MRPPICAICDKDLDGGEGGLVYFAKRPSDIEWDEKMKRLGRVGHPPYAEWFCDRHFTIDKAFEILMKESSA
jgi:hypothetical protein